MEGGSFRTRQIEQSHILTSKETKSKRHKRGTKVVADADARKLGLMLPYK